MNEDVRTASGRRHCRKCGALAGVTQNLCATCRSTEVRQHLHTQSNASRPTSDQMQKAYAASLQTAPQVLPAGGYTTAIMSGAAPILHDQPTLTHAQRFGATLAVVPTTTHAAEVFFAYSRRGFYLHVRTLLRQLDPRRRTPTRRRDGAPRARKDVKGQQASNLALAKALRLTRIYLQMEMIPLALKLDCSQSQVWHLEKGQNAILHKWVERYALVFGLKTEGLYAFSASLQAEPEASPKRLLKLFVTHAMGHHAEKSASPATHEVKLLTGAAQHIPRQTQSAKRSHAGTGFPMNKAIGQALRYVRMRGQIGVPEFTASSGMSSTHVYNMECDYKRVGNHIVEKYADVCGISAQAIWRLADEIMGAQANTIDDQWLADAYHAVISQ